MSSESISTDDEEEVAAASEESARQLISTLLQLSESGEMHDCTIRASSPTSSCYKDFQCHKLILSLSSDKFKTMFSSNFKETLMGPDEPIVQDAEPEVFACVMRYIYGREKDFKDFSFGVEVYILANNLLIESLMQELDTFFMGYKKASEVFAIFDLYLTLNGNQMTLKSCKGLLERETAAALASEQWLNVSVEAVQEFLQLEHLNVEEIDLVKALIKWGKHQVQKDGDDPTDGQKLRSKIFPALKHIRFVGLTQDEFANLCLEELGAVLNLAERNAVFLAIATKRWDLIPSEIFTQEAATPRKKDFAVCQLAFSVLPPYQISSIPLSAYLGFVLNKNADFAGLTVNSKSNSGYGAFSFELLDAAENVIGQGSSTDTINAEGKEFVKANPSCALTAGTIYTLNLTFPCSNLKGNLYSFHLLPSQPAATSKGLTVSITTPNVNAYVEKMLFLLT